MNLLPYIYIYINHVNVPTFQRLKFTSSFYEQLAEFNGRLIVRFISFWKFEPGSLGYPISTVAWICLSFFCLSLYSPFYGDGSLLCFVIKGMEEKEYGYLPTPTWIITFSFKQWCIPSPPWEKRLTFQYKEFSKLT